MSKDKKNNIVDQPGSEFIAGMHMVNNDAQYRPNMPDVGGENMADDNLEDSENDYLGPLDLSPYEWRTGGIDEDEANTRFFGGKSIVEDIPPINNLDDKISSDILNLYNTAVFAGLTSLADKIFKLADDMNILSNPGGTLNSVTPSSSVSVTRISEESLDSFEEAFGDNGTKIRQFITEGLYITANRATAKAMMSMGLSVGVLNITQEQHDWLISNWAWSDPEDGHMELWGAWCEGRESGTGGSLRCDRDEDDAPAPSSGFVSVFNVEEAVEPDGDDDDSESNDGSDDGSDDGSVEGLEEDASTDTSTELPRNVMPEYSASDAVSAPNLCPNIISFASDSGGGIYQSSAELSSCYIQSRTALLAEDNIDLFLSCGHSGGTWVMPWTKATPPGYFDAVGKERFHIYISRDNEHESSQQGRLWEIQKTAYWPHERNASRWETPRVPISPNRELQQTATQFVGHEIEDEEIHFERGTHNGDFLQEIWTVERWASNGNLRLPSYVPSSSSADAEVANFVIGEPEQYNDDEVFLRKIYKLYETGSSGRYGNCPGGYVRAGTRGIFNGWNDSADASANVFFEDIVKLIDLIDKFMGGEVRIIDSSGGMTLDSSIENKIRELMAPYLRPENRFDTAEAFIRIVNVEAQLGLSTGN